MSAADQQDDSPDQGVSYESMSKSQEMLENSDEEMEESSAEDDEEEEWVTDDEIDDDDVKLEIKEEDEENLDMGIEDYYEEEEDE